VNGKDVLEHLERQMKQAIKRAIYP